MSEDEDVGAGGAAHHRAVVVGEAADECPPALQGIGEFGAESRATNDNDDAPSKREETTEEPVDQLEMGAHEGVWKGVVVGVVGGVDEESIRRRPHRPLAAVEAITTAPRNGHTALDAEQSDHHADDRRVDTKPTSHKKGQE